MRRIKHLLFALLAVSGPVVEAQKLHPRKVYPAFPLGPTGIRVSIEKDLVVTAQGVDPGSPAAGAAVRAGDVIVSVNGRSLEAPDPRVVLGEAIGRAEADDGLLVLGTRRGAEARTVTVKLPVLGAYRVTWPLRCPKSRAIIAANATHVSGGLQDDGSYVLGDRTLGANDLKASVASLFLLSTGDDQYLPGVRRHARALAKAAEGRRNAGGHVNWQLGYQGIFLGEYYLRTGDRQVLAGLEEICDWAAEGQAAGGWGHGPNPGAGYVQSGLMNHTTVPIVCAMILARECGVDFDEGAYLRAVKFLYRMAGHGCVPYGDHRSELGWSTTNGRNAMLACAFSLLDEKRFRMASRHLALLVTDSYHQPEFGHTGGGFNVMWRGLASVHVPEERRIHYQRQMKMLAWYYDLARLPDGGFSMLATPPDNTRYSGRGWGACIGLTYTAPLGHLRITGAPRGKFSVQTPPLGFSWGAKADLAFLSTEDATGFGEESVPPHEVYKRLLGAQRELTTVEFAARHLRHYSPLVRTWAGRWLKDRNDDASHAALAAAAAHSDPRVRRAAYDAISGYDNWGRPFRRKIASSVVSRKFLPAILKTLGDPDAAWWEWDGALFALGCAEPADIRAHLSLVRPFSSHGEWYLREGAFWAVVGLHGTMTAGEFNLLSDIYGASRHVFERSSYDAGFRTLLKGDQVAVNPEDMQEAVRTVGETIHAPNVMDGYGSGGIHEATHRTMMVLRHFDPQVYAFMIDDFVAYLDAWEPYYQHSVWLITGSKWQPGIPKVLEGLGPEGRPIVQALRRVMERYDTFDQKRIGKAGADLKTQIEAAIAEWEERQP